MLTSLDSKIVLNQDVERLLTKYECPYKLHEVRAAFMGAITSPFVVDPAFELHALWDGEFPEIDSDEAIKEIQDTFLTRLWDALSAHSDPDNPFTLTPIANPVSIGDLMNQARIRGEELDAFMDGFFQDQEDFDLDPDAAESINVLEELIAMYLEIINMDPQNALSASDLEALILNSAKMHEMAEAEINNLIMLCA
jgi:hypothetical protein